MPWVVIVKSALAVGLVVGLLAPLAGRLERSRPEPRSRANGRPPEGGARRAGPRLPAVAAAAREGLAPDGPAPPRLPIAPMLLWIPVVAACAVLPFGGVYGWRDGVVSLSAGNPDWGVLYVLVLGAVSGGMAAAASRATTGPSQRLLWELALALTFPLVIGLSLVGLVMVFGSLRLADLAVAQDATLRLSMILEGMGVRPPGWLEAMPLGLPRWGLLLQPLGFGLCLVGVLGIWQTGPLGSAAGVPHSGALRFLRLAGLAVTASLLTTLFLGGWTIPWWPTASIVTGISPLLGTAVATIVCMALHVTAFAGKALAMVWLHLRLEQRLPEFRYDRVLRMYWQILLPLALANILATALAMSSLERLRG